MDKPFIGYVSQSAFLEMQAGEGKASWFDEVCVTTRRSLHKRQDDQDVRVMILPIAQSMVDEVFEQLPEHERRALVPNVQGIYPSLDDIDAQAKRLLALSKSIHSASEKLAKAAADARAVDTIKEA